MRAASRCASATRPQQLQLDVYGEVMDALHQARSGVDRRSERLGLQRALIEHLAEDLGEPDEGIWEMRGPPRTSPIPR